MLPNHQWWADITAMTAWRIELGMSVSAHLRRAYRLPHMALHVAWVIVLAATAFHWQSPAQWDRTASRWSAKLLRILGVRLTVMPATPRMDGALLVANHISWLDIFVIYAMKRVHFVSKAEVQRWPVAGWLGGRAGTLYIERAKRSDTARINREMRAILEQGGCVAVFPEGTSSDGRHIRRFLPSLLQPAVDLGLPVIPAALRYCQPDGSHSDAPNYIDQMSFAESLWRVVGTPAIHARLEFGAVQRGSDRRALALAAQAEVARMLGVSVTDKPPGWPGGPQDAGQ
ncbi:MAG: lysophospholipid acyltransferase family protein [Thiobacillaceae bacterium]